jgi:monoamine oxidase
MSHNRAGSTSIHIDSKEEYPLGSKDNKYSKSTRPALCGTSIAHAVLFSTTMVVLAVVLVLMSIGVWKYEPHSALGTFGNGILSASNGNSGVHCDVAVIGAGISGVYAAYRIITKSARTSVCLFESETRIGGRLKTVVLGNGKRRDVGGVRVNEEHTDMKNLAAELGIVLQPGEYMDRNDAGGDESKINVWMIARGKGADNGADLRQAAFPTVDPELSPWDLILSGANDNSQYTDTQSFTRSMFGSNNTEAWEWFKGTYRFPGDFDQGVDAKTYAEFAGSDSINTINYYPVGGMGSFVDKMYSTIASNKRFTLYNAETVASVDKANNPNRRYVIATDRRTVTASTVIFAATPAGLMGIDGSIGARLATHNMVTGSKPILVTTLTQRFASRWWEQAFPHKRVWTTDNCLQLLEMPLTPGSKETNALRVSYADGACAYYWKSLFKQPTAVVNAVVKMYLQSLFPGVAIPDPLETVTQVWDNAWHFESPGAQYTIAEKRAWAIRPIAGEKVAIVGEAFNLQRTWSNGVIAMVNEALNQHLGILDQ